MSRSVWIKKDVYPLMGAVGLALGIAGYATYMQAIRNPDNQVMKSRRLTDLRNEVDEKEGRAWRSAQRKRGQFFQRVNRALYPEDMAINSDLYRDPVGGAPKLREHGV